MTGYFKGTSPDGSIVVYTKLLSSRVIYDRAIDDSKCLKCKHQTQGGCPWYTLPNGSMWCRHCIKWISKEEYEAQKIVEAL